MEQILEFITQYGLENVLCAVVITMLTGIIKVPLKKIASKAEDSKKYTKYITFLPVILGFGAMTLYTYLTAGKIEYNQQFFVSWLSSVSVSLAIYAFWEKFIPSKNKILSEAEINDNKAIVSCLQKLLISKEEASITESGSTQVSDYQAKVIDEGENTETVSAIAENVATVDTPVKYATKKIILGKGNDAETE